MIFPFGTTMKKYNYAAGKHNRLGSTFSVRIGSLQRNIPLSENLRHGSGSTSTLNSGLTGTATGTGTGTGTAM